MAPKKGAVKPKKAAAVASRDEEWLPSRMGEVEINRMVKAGILPNRVTAGWRPVSGEPFLMLHTNKVVVFKIFLA